MSAVEDNTKLEAAVSHVGQLVAKRRDPASVENGRCLFFVIVDRGHSSFGWDCRFATLWADGDRGLAERGRYDLTIERASQDLTNRATVNQTA